MSSTNYLLQDKIYDYLIAASLREPPILKRLREETAKLPMSIMQVAPDQGQFMSFLVKLTGVRKAIELGVYTGYSSLAVALVLPPDGRLIACDINDEYTSVAKRYWDEAGVAQKIDLRLGPALDTLNELIEAGDAGSYDFAFIDADKVEYAQYFEQCLHLLRVGGLILVDNVFGFGKVFNESNTDEAVQAVCAFNKKLLNDDRVDISMMPIGDGLTLARKN
tara:strand:- start:41 stop:703 length:663 start_codon:yes stop_codon:yes gene_type:complete